MSHGVLAFGRFNAPTELGHGKLIDAVQAHAKKVGGQPYIFPSHTQDAKKNPLSHGEKVSFMRRLFPNANIVSHDRVRTIIDAMKHLESMGHTHAHVVAGSDRVEEYKKLLNKYRKTEFPKIKKVTVVSAGQRDPDAEGAEGMSASKLRDLVKTGNREEFISHYSDPKLGAEIHDRVKAGMKMESVQPVGIFLIGGPGSGKDYVLNNIFSRFDLTEVQIDHLLNGAADELLEQKKNIVINGAIDEEKLTVVSALLENYNLDYVYVSVTNKVSRLRNGLRDNPLAENKRVEKWLRAEKLADSLNAFVFNNSINLNESSDFEKVFFADQIEKLLERLLANNLEIQEIVEAKTFTPVSKHKSGLPKKYVAGLSDKTAAARKAHWKKMSKYSDRDPRAYKPAPGDATAKTKLSKYTKKYRAMYGEEVEAEIKPTHSVEEIAAKHGVSQADIIQALSIGKQVEKEHTNDEHTAEQIALAHLWEKPDYYTQLAKMEQLTGDVQSNLSSYAGPKMARKIGRQREIGHFRDVHRREREAHRIAVTKEEAIAEGKSDSSLSAKAKKSGISVGTLRKVYNRGVAAWNSGHRPGTTPQQWGHARVNSYITKGKTYHTADKDLRENTEQVDEMQLIGTDSYRRHAISMTPGQDQKIADAFPVKEADSTDLTPKLTTKRKASGDKVTSGYTARLSGLSVVSNLAIAEKTSVGKSILKNLKTIKLRTEEEELKEAVDYHLQNKISFTENTFRPGSEMFFEMIKEAKRLYNEGKYTPADEWEQDMLETDIGEVVEYEGQMVVLDYPIEEGLEECWKGYTQKGMKKKGDKMVPNCVPVNEEDLDEAEKNKGIMPTPRQVPAPPGGHPVPAGYERVKSWGGGWELRKIKEEDETKGKGIGKPWREGGGGAVYVRSGDGGIKKVRFSQSGMKKKFMDPAATRSFVARHHCLTNKDKTSASYWACRYPRFFSNSGKTWW